MMATTYDLGFIGAGQMAGALAEGMVRSGMIAADRICFVDPSDSAAEHFRTRTGGAARCSSSRQLADQTRMVWLAVKPQMSQTVLGELGNSQADETLFISVVAGVTLDRLADQLGTRRLIRVMPNTPCLIGQGAIGFTSDQAVAADGRDRVKKLLASVGTVFEVSEPLLDAVTGLSGSGPAYVFLIIDALIEGGVRMGLPREIACGLAVETVRGSAALMETTGMSAATLRDQVTSPGGTTAAGLFHLEEHGLRAALMGAVEAATRRSQEIAAI